VLASAQAPDRQAGHTQFENSCAVCHGGDAMGGEHGPAIAGRLRRLTGPQVAALVHNGIPSRGMPAFPTLTGNDFANLLAFLRSLRPVEKPLERRSVQTRSGATLSGVILSESSEDLALRTDDQSIHLLRGSGNSFREVTSQSDWPSYNGGIDGNRFTQLTQINKSNVASLGPRWIFPVPDVPPMEVTPVVVDGIMYVTSANQCYALDAGNGRPLWHFFRNRTKGVGGGGGGGINRGVAWAGKRLFMVTDNAHLLALNRFTGELEWETTLIDWRLNYDTTSAPLVVGDLVISGTAGGEGGARGFLAAFNANTGKEVWRFWTVPKPGEPGSETWKGNAIAHGGAVAWFTGSYDPATGTLYWQTGNPGPDYNGAQRLGDNLYSDSILALDAKTGTRKWHYQFTPHDLHDWDAAEPAVLADLEWHGSARKVLLMANRNGFFYVLDRISGELLLAEPFVKKLNWAKEIGPDHRPVLLPLEKVGDGSKVCPSQDGATNWYSTAFLPSTGFYYLQALEKCDIYSQRPTGWIAGKDYVGGSQKSAPGDVPKKFLRAIDVQTGKIAWELPQSGHGDTWGGVLGTATGVLFVGEDSGMFVAVDAADGKVLWRFPANQPWKASPMTYQFDGKQYVAVATGQTITAFGLPD
jgi:alcohol dehydrogenase (cytochrome c)